MEISAEILALAAQSPRSSRRALVWCGRGVPPRCSQLTFGELVEAVAVCRAAVKKAVKRARGAQAGRRDDGGSSGDDHAQVRVAILLPPDSPSSAVDLPLVELAVMAEVRSFNFRVSQSHTSLTYG